MDRYREICQELLSLADININGDRPWDIQVHDERFYKRVLAEGNVGIGESYMDGWWDCERLDEFFNRAFKARLDKRVRRTSRFLLRLLMAKILNRQSRTRASRVAEVHYNLDNEFFQRMLDRRMVYTCAYWDGAETLEQAQEKKLDLVCRKIGLQEGMTVLDLGCGWGSFAKYAAEKYGAVVVGVNIAGEQVLLGRELCKGLPVELRQEDYRKVVGKFDRVISIGIMEHVGPKNYRAYMDVVDRCLTQEGIAFIHTIGNNEPYVLCDPWFDKYIYPNGVIPSLSQLLPAIEGKFVVEDLHNIGPHYDRTCMEWNNRFQRSWPFLKEKYPDRFKRMWEYYLLGSAGAFRSRGLQVWQIVMTRVGTPQPRCRLS